MSVKCMIFCDGQILLLQKKDREGTLPWEFPGGGLEFGEDLKAAAIREAREETGLDITILEVAGLWSYARSEKQFLTGVIFIAEAKSRRVSLSHEHVAYTWVKPETLHHFRLQESLRAALDQIHPRHEQGEALRNYFCEHYQKDGRP